MNHEAMEAKVRALFDARATNNAAKLADFLADDVVFFVRGHWTSAISQYPVRGKRAYIEMLRLMIVQLENLGSTFHETMAQG
jgi:ketosteroid isomerase-like protein